MSTTSSFRTTQITCAQFASTDVPISIPSGGTPTVASTTDVTDVGTITDVDVLFLIGTHTWISDLDFNLQSPVGTLVQIMAPSSHA